MLNYKRSARVGELIQQELSKLLLENPVPGVGFVTITGIKLTDDLQTARAFYSVIGSPEEIESSIKAIKEATPEIRHQLALRLNLRRTPTIEMVFDETPQRAGKIFEILEKIKDEEKE